VTTSTTQSGDTAGEISKIAQRDRGDLDNALGVLRERVEAEFRITERLDAKCRQAFALAAAAFTVAQASAFTSFGQAEVSTLERLMILLTALMAAAALGLTAIRLQRSEKPQAEKALDPRTVVELCRTAVEPGIVTAGLVWNLGELGAKRVEGNERRIELTRAVASAAQATFAISGIELMVALITRV